MVEDFARFGKQQGVSFSGGEAEVGIAARAKPEPLDPSTAHNSVFLKAKREVM